MLPPVNPQPKPTGRSTSALQTDHDAYRASKTRFPRNLLCCLGFRHKYTGDYSAEWFSHKQIGDNLAAYIPLLDENAWNVKVTEPTGWTLSLKKWDECKYTDAAEQYHKQWPDSTKLTTFETNVHMQMLLDLGYTYTDSVGKRLFGHTKTDLSVLFELTDAAERIFAVTIVNKHVADDEVIRRVGRIQKMFPTRAELIAQYGSNAGNAYDNSAAATARHNPYGGGGISASKSKWTSTGRTVALKDGSRRTLYKNPARVGELRVKRMVVRKGATAAVATYVKPPPCQRKVHRL